MEISAAINAFLRSRLAFTGPATVQGHAQKLERFRRSMEARGVTDIGQVDTAALLDYLASAHERGVSANTLNGYRSSLGALMSWCGRPDLMEAVPKARPPAGAARWQRD